MALIQCRVCKGAVASNAKACPHCGVSKPSANLFWGGVVGRLMVLALFGVAVYSCVHSMNDTAPTVTNDGKMDALLLCQQAITQTATNPSSAVVPYAADHGGKGEHYFAWPKGAGLTLMNGFGAHVDSSASCITTADGKTITSLTINGETFR